MIKVINAGPGIQVQHYNGSPYINSNAPSAGMLRYYQNDIQVYDGNSWMTISGSANVSFDASTEAILAWAREKRSEDLNLKALMEKHPGLKDAYEKFEIMKILVNEEGQKNG